MSNKCNHRGYVPRFPSRDLLKEWLSDHVPHYKGNVRGLLLAVAQGKVSQWEARQIERWQFNDALAYARRHNMFEGVVV